VVPWCDQCDRFLSPSTVTAEGTCPACHQGVEAGRARAADQPVTTNHDTSPTSWHFKAFAGALALYLGYRAFQGLAYLGYVVAHIG
jgi:hypothetical protein